MTLKHNSSTGFVFPNRTHGIGECLTERLVPCGIAIPCCLRGLLQDPSDFYLFRLDLCEPFGPLPYMPCEFGRLSGDRDRLLAGAAEAMQRHARRRHRLACIEHRHPRDVHRVIADTGWGIKPDDQPANANERGPDTPRLWHYNPSQPDVVRQILRAQRRAFNAANRVRVEPGRTIIFDINKDGFLIEGLGWGDENLIVLLQTLGAAFNPQELRRLSRDEPASREFPLSRAWAWGAERSG